MRRITNDAESAGSGDSEPEPLQGTNGGTYGNRYNERSRFRRRSNYDGRNFEAEHIYGYRVVHNVKRISPAGQVLEAAMPAYLERTALHQQHAGSAYGRNNLTARGWPSYAAYRVDQKATLFDPIAESEGSSISNGYQLNQLGYGHQIAELYEQGRFTTTISAEIEIATDSFFRTVTCDPALTVVSDQGQIRNFQLGPRGQAEALLSRETIVTRKWPTQGREREIFGYFLRAYFEQADRVPIDANNVETAPQLSNPQCVTTTSSAVDAHQEISHAANKDTALRAKSQWAVDECYDLGAPPSLHEGSQKAYREAVGPTSDDERVLADFELQEEADHSERAFFAEWDLDSDGHLHPRSDFGRVSASDGHFSDTADEDAVLTGLRTLELNDREPAIIYCQERERRRATEMNSNPRYGDASKGAGDPSECLAGARLPDTAAPKVGTRKASSSNQTWARPKQRAWRQDAEDGYNADIETPSPQKRATLDKRSNERSFGR
ncbi:hypothetical protein [Rhizobium leguminosarum]|uniref:hypothetical protein n=1 Tax=Rhizobium leguminosarum TaxID=384 RepID=UPI001C921382|nr:hypothetical protein [Rhizobium leguminosarum]MBY3027404.1 hypothetical protein [Rhizobium leguminosarum]